MSVRNDSELSSLNSSRLPDNNTRFISADKVRNQTQDIIDSKINKDKIVSSLNSPSSSEIPNSLAVANALDGFITDAELATALLDKQDKAIVVSSNTTAVNDAVYHNVATATYTDPSPTEGKGFTVFVRNGTATVGGTAYATGKKIIRTYHSGSWLNDVFTIDSVGDITPVNTLIADNDSINKFASKTQGQFNAIIKDEIGQVISEQFSSTANFTGYGSVFTVSGGNLVIAGGSTKTLATSLYQSAYGKTSSHNWTQQITITAGTLSATSYGVGLGVSQGLVTITGAVLLDTASVCKLAFYANGSLATEFISSSSLPTVNASDVLVLTLKRVKSTFILTVTNTSQNNVSITHTLNALSVSGATYNVPTAGYFSIYALGGNFTADNYLVYLNDIKGGDLIVGDSICSEFNTSSSNQSWVNRLAELSNNNIVVNAGPGNRIQDLNATEILLYEPRSITILLGTNNLYADTPSVAIGRINTLVSSLTGYTTANNNLVVCAVPPNNTTDSAPFNAEVRSAYTTHVIDFYYVLKTGGATTFNTSYSSDGAHPNSDGAFLMANTAFNKLVELGIYRKAYNPRPYNNAVYQNAGKVYLGEQPNRIATHVIEIETANGGNAFRISKNNTTGGGFLNSYNASVLVMQGGSYMNTSLQAIAQSTTASSVRCDSGKVFITSNTGLTVGNSFSFTTKAVFGNNYIALSGNDLNVVRTTNLGSDITAYFVVDNNANLVTVNTKTFGYNQSQGAFFTTNNASRRIITTAINDITVSNTAGSEESNLGIYTKSAGSGIALRVTFAASSITFIDAYNLIVGTTTGTKFGTATTQKIGFWNATPIVQPTTAVAAATFVANTSGIANDTATFDGYTIGQVVKALRNTGLLA